jgi:hypothetical protein
MIVRGSPAAGQEDEAYRTLAASFSELAAQVQSAASRMAECRTLPAAPHDEAAYGPEQLGAFERYVGRQNDLLMLLRIAAEQDQRMLKGMQTSAKE